MVTLYSQGSEDDEQARTEVEDLFLLHFLNLSTNEVSAVYRTS